MLKGKTKNRILTFVAMLLKILKEKKMETLVTQKYTVTLIITIYVFGRETVASNRKSINIKHSVLLTWID